MAERQGHRVDAVELDEPEASGRKGKAYTAMGMGQNWWLLRTLPWESDTLRSEDVDACFGNTLGA